MLGPLDAALILGGIILGGLLFVVCVVLQFHYHDPIPSYIWVLALDSNACFVG